MPSEIKSLLYGQENKTMPTSSYWLSIFCKRPGVNDFLIGYTNKGWFLQHVHLCLCKRILHKINFRKTLWWVIPWHNWVDEKPLCFAASKVFYASYSMLDFSLKMACGQRMKLRRVPPESLKGEETLHHPSLTQENTAEVLSDLSGKPVILAFLIPLNGEKKNLCKSNYLADMAKFCYNGD